jgi:hypothetical protein
MANNKWIANPHTWTYHIVKGPYNVTEQRFKALCGRVYGGGTLERFPGGARTCETCLRIGAWADDKEH